MFLQWEIHTVCLTLAFEDDPLTLIQMHPILLWFSAGVELSVKIRRRMDPRVWMKYPFNKADYPRHSRGKRRSLKDSCSCFCHCAKVTVQLSEIWRCCSVGLVICEHIILLCIRFRSSGFTNLDPLCYVFLRWHCCIWQKDCGSVKKTILGHSVDYCTYV